MLVPPEERQRNINPATSQEISPEESNALTIPSYPNPFIVYHIPLNNLEHLQVHHQIREWILRLWSPVTSQKEKVNTEVSTPKLKNDVWRQLTQQRSKFSKTKAGGDRFLPTNTKHLTHYENNQHRKSGPGNSFLKRENLTLVVKGSYTIRNWGADSLGPLARGESEVAAGRLVIRILGHCCPTSLQGLRSQHVLQGWLQPPFSEEIRAALPLLKIFEKCKADGPTLISRSCASNGIVQ